MKRATLLLDNELYRRAKILSKSRGSTLKEVINDLLREGLNSFQEKPKKPKPFVLPLHSGCQPIEGVDISDRNQLYDIFDNEKSDE